MCGGGGGYFNQGFTCSHVLVHQIVLPSLWTQKYEEGVFHSSIEISFVKKCNKGIRPIHVEFRKQSARQRGLYRGQVRVGVMPAIWVINPMCLSQGWGLIRAVITLG
jgi:hypothetical protein